MNELPDPTANPTANPSPTRLTVSSVVPLLPEMWVKISSFTGFAGLNKEQRARLEQAIEEAGQLLATSQQGVAGPFELRLSREARHLLVTMTPTDPSQTAQVPDESGWEWRLLRRLADAVKFEPATSARGSAIEFAYLITDTPRRLSQSLDIGEFDEAGFCVLTLTGRLDSVTAPHLDQVVEARLQAGAPHLLLDTAALEYLSSAGIRLFARYAKALEGRGLFGLVRPSERTREVMTMAGLDRQIASFATARAAVGALKSGL